MRPQFTLGTPSGEAIIDGCQQWSLLAAFEFDPDDVPEVRSFELVLDGSAEAEFECTITLSQDHVCGEGYYRQGDGEEGSLCVEDGDGDGYGTTSPALACTDAGTDCDDSDSAIYPNASTLDIADGIDINCDGEDNLNYPEDDLAIWGGVELSSGTTGSDLHLGMFLEAGDWDNDGADDLYIGGYLSRDGSEGYILTGPLSSWDTTIENAATDHDEQAVGVGFGDIDGDGNTDFAAAGWMDNSTYGAAWFGPLTGTMDSATADFNWDRPSCQQGSYSFNKYESEDVQFGDIDGDGQDDFIVGSTSHNGVCNGGSGVSWGAVYVTLGPLSADPSLSDADLTLTGDYYPDTYGRWPEVLDDMDGDGIDDLVTGSYRGGNAHLVLDVASHSSGYLRDEADLVIEIESGSKTTATSAGDWDGDGYGDLLVGVANVSGDGALYLGSASPSATAAVSFEDSAENTAGSGLAGGGDFDGDGFDDVAFHTANSGVYLVYGGVTSGSYDLDSDSDAVLEWTSSDLAEADEGRSILFADFDHDGLDDLAIGLPGMDNGSDEHGGVMVLPGQ